MARTPNRKINKPVQKPVLPESPLALFHSPVREWFEAVFSSPTLPQELGWPVISKGESALILAPTGTGKTLAAFLWCIDRLMFTPPPPAQRCRVLYISPIKALAVDVERNLRAPLVGVGHMARKGNIDFTNHPFGFGQVTRQRLNDPVLRANRRIFLSPHQSPSIDADLERS